MVRSWSRSLVLVALVALVAAALAGCGGGATEEREAPSEGARPADLTVVERNNTFEPAELEVKVGETVTFSNEDEEPHNVSIDGESLGNQSQGETVEWTAEKPGTFRYLCTIHPSMTALITVTDE